MVPILASLISPHSKYLGHDSTYIITSLGVYFFIFFVHDGEKEKVLLLGYSFLLGTDLPYILCLLGIS